MSLDQHIPLAKEIESSTKNLEAQEKLREIFWRLVPSLWGDFSIVKNKKEVLVTRKYDFSGVTPEEHAELQEIFERNRERLRAALDSGDTISSIKMESPTWAAPYISWYTINIWGYDFWDQVIDRHGNLIQHPEYVWPFCDITTHCAITSILDACYLRPESVSENQWEHNKLTAMIADLEEDLWTVQAGLRPNTHALDIDDIRWDIHRFQEQTLVLNWDITTEKEHQNMVFLGKPMILVTPESYQSACETLGIEGCTPYAQAHKSYMRKLALYHPDRIIKIVLESLPSKPTKIIFSIDRGERTSLKEKHEAYKRDECSIEAFQEMRKEYIEWNLGMIEIELRNIVTSCEMHIGKKRSVWTDTPADTIFSEDFLNKLKLEFWSSPWPIQDREWFRKTIQREYLHLKYFDLSLEEFEEIQAKFVRKEQKWNEEFEKKKGDIGELYAKNRQTLMDAWEIIQSYHGMPWEQVKDIDIIYAEKDWYNDPRWLYHAIEISNTDVIVVNAFLRKRGDLWTRFGLNYDYDTGRMKKGEESSFSQVFHSFPEASRPHWLDNLKDLLMSRNYEPEKIQAQARKLREWKFTKPERFDRIMQSIEEHPWLYSESYEEHEFEPTLLFGKGYTWPYSIYPQDFSIPLWLLFGHIYLNTTGVIPFRLGEKFVRKYLPDSTPHEVAEILEQLQQRIPGKTILESWLEDYYEKSLAIQRKYNRNAKFSETDTDLYEDLERKLWRCERLAQCIDEMNAWPTVYLADDIGDYGDSSRIGVEIAPNGSLSLYYPLMEHDACEGKLCTLHFLPKEVATLYLAMLESPILDSMDNVLNRLTHVRK